MTVWILCDCTHVLLSTTLILGIIDINKTLKSVPSRRRGVAWQCNKKSKKGGGSAALERASPLISCHFFPLAY